MKGRMFRERGERKECCRIEESETNESRKFSRGTILQEMEEMRKVPMK